MGASILKGLFGTDVTAQLSAMGLVPDEAFGKAEEAWNRFWEELESIEPRVIICRNLTIRGVFENKVARDSYFKLCRAGLSQPEVFEMLVGMAVIPRKGKDPNWLSGSGMTAKQINYLPKRLQDSANQIERLNKHPNLTPGYWIRGRKIAETKSEFAIDLLGKLLMGLPSLLRVYAAFISGHSRSMREKKESRSRPRSQVLAQLVQIVRKQTGRPMFSDLSNVLTAAAHGAKTGSLGLDPDSLKSLDAAYRNKAKLSTAG
jgi:hypothetical protein